METKKFNVENKFDKTRLDMFLLTQLPNHTRNNLQNLIANQKVQIDGKIVTKTGTKLKSGNVVFVEIPDPVKTDIEPENIPLDIVYEDDDLLVINKQQGLTVHPAQNCFSGTMVNALLHHVKNLSGINGQMRPGIVHRLDKDTSGLLLVAKNDYAHNFLAKQIANKTCVREYLALLNGVVKKDEGEIETYIERNPKNRKEMYVPKTQTGKLAITTFKVEKRFDKFTLVRFRLKTGRTHQIRVHAKYMGHPVACDPVYGKGEQFGLCGQLLHSAYISFVHPTTKQTLSFSAPLPENFAKVLNKLDTSKNKMA